MLPTNAYARWSRTALLCASASLLLSAGCSTTPTPVPLPTLPEKPSVTMPRPSIEILQSAEQKLQRWQTRQQQRLMQLTPSPTHGPQSPNGTQPPAHSPTPPKD